MTDTPWLDDACSLVDAFRAGTRSPKEELQATLDAIAASDLNCFSFLDPERALAAAERADLNKPFGGVPVGIKELDQVEGWPDTGASLVFKDRLATYTGESVRRFIEDGGAVPVGLTTASEFGGLNVSVTKLNGVTHNPWRRGRTAGGSSGGSAAAVAGGLVTIASGGDGGGSIRIPAGYCGLLGMKGTYGRISRGPVAFFRPGTVVLGCLARSVRDAARHFDVCAGVDPRDPWSLPNPGGWEAGLGRTELRGKRVAVLPSIAGVRLEPGVEERIRAAAKDLIELTGMVEVDIDLRLPNLAAQWAMGNLSTLLAELGPYWPRCAKDLTDEIALGTILAQSLYNLHLASVAEAQRVQANEAMATAFEQVDYIISATNPGPAFPAEATTSSPTETFIDRAKASPAARAAFRAVMATVRVVGGAFPRLSNALVDAVVEKVPDLVTMGGLTIISNIYGNPAVSIPAGTLDGLPIGMQVLARHHRDAELFDVALAYEREIGWPKVAPAVSGVAPSSV
ncbi:amidase [Rhabdothermincola sp.]|uniref:amidase n=1 Tax=Rhabdothermincola sp. TaxID=2820405 RepID=UPI002FE0E1C9